ncbi:MAG: TlpA disulfide reductase family protein [Rhodospirillales bacterium]|nr:TlpA disulfide reductase family protein [Rhodospirillales bacterium]
MPHGADRTASPNREAPGRRAALAFLGAAFSSVLARRAEAKVLPLLSRRLVRLHPPEAPPALHFKTATGETQTLADFRGKGVVLNVWATWCVPCKAEMPALNHLATIVAPDGIVVLPVSIDTGGLKAVQKFYAANHIAHLPILLDPDGGIARALKAPGVPTTVIVDRKGLIEGRVEGAVQWDAPASIALLRRLVGPAE